MTTLEHFRHDGSSRDDHCDGAEAQARLQHLGIESGRWVLRQQPVSSTPQLTYARELQALQRRLGAVRTDRVRTLPSRRAEVPALDATEVHLHADVEARVVLEGHVRFVIATGIGGGWAAVDCKSGDWIVLPEGLPHLLQPSLDRPLDLLRLFTRPRGWASHASDIGQPPVLSSRAPLQLAA
jgi:cupin superfamily acireductone dioxygenase involved in methionine salvage